jgi:ubiquinone/menaquinone biosynthesis C-methylase UbiE
LFKIEAVSPDLPPIKPEAALERELAYYERAYSSYIPGLFAQSAVVQFRQYLVKRILRATGAGAQSRILSIGCGIGDTELLLAPHVGHVTGVDLSPVAIREARRAAAARGISNVHFAAAGWQTLRLFDAPFHTVVAIFFLHHLPAADLRAFPGQLKKVLPAGGIFYSLDPSARRLSGFLGELLVPKLMRKHQTDDEHPLLPQSTAAEFRSEGFETVTRWFDFTSTPIAGLFPSWKAAYRVGRLLDEGLTRVPLLRQLSSNFELIGRRPK